MCSAASYSSRLVCCIKPLPRVDVDNNIRPAHPRPKRQQGKLGLVADGLKATTRKLCGYPFVPLQN